MSDLEYGDGPGPQTRSKSRRRLKKSVKKKRTAATRWSKRQEALREDRINWTLAEVMEENQDLLEKIIKRKNLDRAGAGPRETWVKPEIKVTRKKKKLGFAASQKADDSKLLTRLRTSRTERFERRQAMFDKEDAFEILRPESLTTATGASSAGPDKFSLRAEVEARAKHKADTFANWTLRHGKNLIHSLGEKLGGEKIVIDIMGTMDEPTRLEFGEKVAAAFEALTQRVPRLESESDTAYHARVNEKAVAEMLEARSAQEKASARRQVRQSKLGFDTLAEPELKEEDFLSKFIAKKKSWTQSVRNQATIADNPNFEGVNKVTQMATIASMSFAGFGMWPILATATLALGASMAIKSLNKDGTNSFYEDVEVKKSVTGRSILERRFSKDKFAREFAKSGISLVGTGLTSGLSSYLGLAELTGVGVVVLKAGVKTTVSQGVGLTADLVVKSKRLTNFRIKVLGAKNLDGQVKYARVFGSDAGKRYVKRMMALEKRVLAEKTEGLSAFDKARLAGVAGLGASACAARLISGDFSGAAETLGHVLHLSGDVAQPWVEAILQYTVTQAVVTGRVESQRQIVGYYERNKIAAGDMATASLEAARKAMGDPIVAELFMQNLRSAITDRYISAVGEENRLRISKTLVAVKNGTVSVTKATVNTLIDGQIANGIMADVKANEFARRISDKGEDLDRLLAAKRPDHDMIQETRKDITKLSAKYQVYLGSTLAAGISSIPDGAKSLLGKVLGTLPLDKTSSVPSVDPWTGNPGLERALDKYLRKQSGVDADFGALTREWDQQARAMKDFTHRQAADSAMKAENADRVSAEIEKAVAAQEFDKPEDVGRFIMDSVLKEIKDNGTKLNVQSTLARIAKSDAFVKASGDSMEKILHEFHTQSSTIMNKAMNMAHRLEMDISQFNLQDPDFAQQLQDFTDMDEYTSNGFFEALKNINMAGVGIGPAFSYMGSFLSGAMSAAEAASKLDKLSGGGNLAGMMANGVFKSGVIRDPSMVARAGSFIVNNKNISAGLAHQAASVDYRAAANNARTIEAYLHLAEGIGFTDEMIATAGIKAGNLGAKVGIKGLGIGTRGLVDLTFYLSKHASGVSGASSKEGAGGTPGTVEQIADYVNNKVDGALWGVEGVADITRRAGYEVALKSAGLLTMATDTAGGFKDIAKSMGGTLKSIADFQDGIIDETSLLGQVSQQMKFNPFAVGAGVYYRQKGYLQGAAEVAGGRTTGSTVGAAVDLSYDAVKMGEELWGTFTSFFSGSEYSDEFRASLEELKTDLDREIDADMISPFINRTPFMSAEESDAAWQDLRRLNDIKRQVVNNMWMEEQSTGPLSGPVFRAPLEFSLSPNMSMAPETDIVFTETNARIIAQADAALDNEELLVDALEKAAAGDPSALAEIQELRAQEALKNESADIIATFPDGSEAALDGGVATSQTAETDGQHATEEAERWFSGWFGQAAAATAGTAALTVNYGIEVQSMLSLYSRDRHEEKKLLAMWAEVKRLTKQELKSSEKREERRRVRLSRARTKAKREKAQARIQRAAKVSSRVNTRLQKKRDKHEALLERFRAVRKREERLETARALHMVHLVTESQGSSGPRSKARIVFDRTRHLSEDHKAQVKRHTLVRALMSTVGSVTDAQAPTNLTQGQLGLREGAFKFFNYHGDPVATAVARGPTGRRVRVYEDGTFVDFDKYGNYVNRHEAAKIREGSRFFRLFNSAGVSISTTEKLGSRLNQMLVRMWSDSGSRVNMTDVIERVTQLRQTGQSDAQIRALVASEFV
jgi:hypothetical protein